MNKESTEQVTETLDTNIEQIEEKGTTNKGGFSDEQFEQIKTIVPFIEKEYEQYEYGDLHVWCNQCGSDTAMLHPGMKNLQTAFITQTPIDNHSIMILSCGVCGNKLALHVKKAINPPKKDEEVAEDTDKQIEKE